MSQELNELNIDSTPGPKPAPILGNILDMRQGEVFETLLEFHKTYGDIVRLELPKNKFSDLPDLKELADYFKKPSTSESPA